MIPDKPIEVLVTNEVITIDGVKFHHHPNGGGLVAETAHADPTALIGPTCIIKDQARILDKAIIWGHVEISGQVEVSKNAKMFGNSRAMEQAVITDDAIVRGEAMIRYKARMIDYSTADEVSYICGTAILSGRFGANERMRLSEGNHHE